jgi:Pentapeptide repeats (8 copies)
MLVRELRPEPPTWSQHKSAVGTHWSLLPFHASEWVFQWTAYYLSRWAFLEVLEYLGIFSVLIAVVFYFHESGDRKKQKHYQAWQVINTAQGKGGSGGRIEALQELNADGVALVGVDLKGAFLQGVKLAKADLHRSNFEDVDLRDSDLNETNLEFVVLLNANLRKSDLHGSDLAWANLQNADLVEANLQGVDLTGANLSKADLHNADLKDVKWEKIKSVAGANIFSVKNTPAGFMDWAMKHGAISVPGQAEDE